MTLKQDVMHMRSRTPRRRFWRINTLHWSC